VMSSHLMRTRRVTGSKSSGGRRGAISILFHRLASCRRTRPRIREARPNVTF
jgi:hypothetical protein